jgi:hypothetical protein
MGESDSSIVLQLIDLYLPDIYIIVMENQNVKPIFVLEPKAQQNSEDMQAHVSREIVIGSTRINYTCDDRKVFTSSLLRPSSNCELTITHVYQFPVFRTQNTFIAVSLTAIHHTCHKTRRHVVVVRRMRISEHGMLHQSRDAPSQCALLRAIATVSDKHVLHALSELQHRCFWRVWLCEVVSMFKHLTPIVAI